MFKHVVIFNIVLVCSTGYVLCMQDNSVDDWKAYCDVEKEYYGDQAIKQAFKAIDKEDLQTLKLLIENGLSLDTRNKEDQNTLLSTAVKMHKEPVVKFLLDNGADVNGKSGYFNIPPLNDAIMNIAPLSIVRLLLNHKDINVNAAHEDGNTALHEAVMFKRNEIIPILIELGADINAKDKTGATALNKATFILRPNPTAAEILRKHGAQENEVEVILKAHGIPESPAHPSYPSGHAMFPADPRGVKRKK